MNSRSRRRRWTFFPVHQLGPDEPPAATAGAWPFMALCGHAARRLDKLSVNDLAFIKLDSIRRPVVPPVMTATLPLVCPQSVLLL